MPQQRLGVAAGFRSHILLGTHPVSAKARIHSSGRICQMRCALAAQSLTLPPGPGWGACLLCLHCGQSTQASVWHRGYSLKVS